MFIARPPSLAGPKAGWYTDTLFPWAWGGKLPVSGVLPLGEP